MTSRYTPASSNTLLSKKSTSISTHIDCLLTRLYRRAISKAIKPYNMHADQEQPSIPISELAIMSPTPSPRPASFRRQALLGAQWNQTHPCAIVVVDRASLAPQTVRHTHTRSSRTLLLPVLRVTHHCRRHVGEAIGLVEHAALPAAYGASHMVD